ncbi:L,D-transpeptidase family protein [Neobacillus cucumis]|nr:L,D-transpeptidase family protein [Neobacillus cucumis]
MRKLSVIFVLLFSIFFFNHAEADAAGSSQLIIINKKTNTLAFYDSGKLVRTFKVATGKTRNLTPEGKFRIVTKIVNRPYYKGHIPGGDPRNPLGNRWLGLEARGTYGTTYAIHGNANESSIGKYISHGCVRMHNNEVRWLFSQVKMYTTVIITYSGSSFDAIAKANGFNVGVTNGWVQSNGHQFYYENGIPKTGWMILGGKTYYFEKTGEMKKGWMILGGKTYYFEKTGEMKKGWMILNGKTYYFEKTGEMKKSWMILLGKTYYFEKTGEMKKGWMILNGKTYYFEKTGEMKKGWMILLGKTYYFEKTGEMKKGWMILLGKEYFFDQTGVMKKGGWLITGGKTYFVDQNGVVKTGWVQIEGKWYYFNPKSNPIGIMAVSTVIDGWNIGADGARLE